eukprot:scaffold21838_cov16-Tisochrysis_lutea.AAC.5
MQTLYGCQVVFKGKDTGYADLSKKRPWSWRLNYGRWADLEEKDVGHADLNEKDAGHADSKWMLGRSRRKGRWSCRR